jgi:hypothetical protein
MNCIICLQTFETNYAYIPILNCDCIFITHNECWDKWTGDCLYCRKVGIPELRGHSLPLYRIILAFGSVGFLIIYIAYLFICIIINRRPF